MLSKPEENRIPSNIIAKPMCAIAPPVSLIFELFFRISFIIISILQKTENNAQSSNNSSATNKIAFPTRAIMYETVPSDFAVAMASLNFVLKTNFHSLKNRRSIMHIALTTANRNGL